MEKLRRDLHSVADLRLYAERLPTSERQELLCAVCLAHKNDAQKGESAKSAPAHSGKAGSEKSADEILDGISCPLFRGGQRLCGQ